MTDSLEQRVYDHVLRELSSGAIGPGSRLSEATLAKVVGVSRTPVREALAKLRAEKIVDVVARFGWFIKTPTAQELADLYAARELLEVFAAGQAAKRGLGEHLGRLESLVRAMEKSVASWRRSSREVGYEKWLQQLADWDREFHEAIFQAAGNVWIERMVAPMIAFRRIFDWKQICARKPTERLALDPKGNRTTSEDEIQEVWAQTVRDHREIFTSITRGDSSVAQDSMSRHIRAGLKTSVEILEYWRRNAPPGSGP